MNNLKSRWLAAVLGLVFVAGLADALAADKEAEKKGQRQQGQPATKPKNPAVPPGGQGVRPGGPGAPIGGAGGSGGTGKAIGNAGNSGGNGTPIGVPRSVENPNAGQPKISNDRVAPKTPVEPRVAPKAPLIEVKKANGVVEQRTSAGALRGTTTVDQKTGIKQTQHIAPTGRIETKEVQKPDGTKQVTHYDLGREKRTEIVRPDKSTVATDVHYNRYGTERSRETITKDASGKAVSRTVVVKQNLVIKNTTIVKNTTVVRNYYPGRWGFVYRPVIIAPVVFASWYDPYWYTPVGVPIYHPFHYSWGWYGDPWYRYHAYYWEPYPVYAAPSYWVTDWMVAGYVADRYAVAVSAEQTRTEAQLAREDAEKAKAAAEQARDAAEIAEAKAAQAAAEARAERAEARAAKVELEEMKRKELAGKPNPNATPIDKDTKEALKNQVEKTIAEKKQFAEQSSKGGNPVPPDVSAALADPKHIYPVSKTISVTRAEDSKPAGTLTAGDLLKLEPGQESTLKDATENTPLNMRVMTSKGEDDSVPAGTLIAVPLKELQEFDNEFRAKIDLGLAEADKNKELFKKGAQQQ